MWRTESEERRVQVRLQAFRFELRPDREQQHQMGRFAGSCRFVFNRALALQKELFELSGAHASYADLCAVLVDWKQDKETDWLNEAPAQALQQSLKNLDAAWARRLDSLKKLKQGRIKRAQLIGEPVFKKKEKHASFRYPQGSCLEQNNNRILLPKLGWVRYRNSREVLGAVKNVTVSLAGGRWMVSIQTEREVEAPVHRSATAVGIDMGVVRLATLSEGTIYGPRNSFRQHQAGLRKSAAIHEPEKPEPKKEVQPELEKSEGSARLPSHPCSQCTSGLSTQGLDRDQQKPRDRVCRGSSGKKHVELGCWQHAESGEQGAGQVRPETIYPRPGLGRIAASAGIQAGLERRPADRRAGDPYQPALSGMRVHRSRQPQDSGSVLLCGMRVCSQRRSGSSNQCRKGWTSPDRL